MASSTPTPDPLEGDLARQADQLNRGITFQIWRSVEAWINLSDAQGLYLEGAEDFDVVGQGTAIGVQTKATAAPITLRSDSVVSLLVNFWRTRATNPSQRVFFRLVTTSPSTVEDQSPFATEGGGLDVWRLCAQRGDLSLAARLKTFLTTDGSISRRLGEKPKGSKEPSGPTLWEFLKTAAPEEILTELIRMVSFQTDSPNSEVVRQSITTSLHAYGERMRLRPNECDAALDRLFRVAAETAGKKENRLLTRERFRLEFEDAVLPRLSPAEIAAIRQGRAPEPPPPFSAELGQAFHSALVIQSGVPELLPPVLTRAKLVQEIVTQIRRVGVVVLGATSGFGKSTIAKLSANALGGDWIWVDLQGLPAGNIPIVVRALSAALAAASGPRNVAFDNLNYQPADLNGLENALAAIARTARLRGGKVILTTQRELSLRLRQKMAFAPEDWVKVPRLTEEEVREFCLLLGCSDDRLAPHAKLVSMQASGHPRLVHARLTGLAAAGWPKVTHTDIFETAPEIVEELDLARQLLGEATGCEKTLLYRLSLLVGEFRRDHAIAIGNISPPLSFPADVFERLVGPWIDRVGQGFFRLSPLLKQAAETNWPQDKISSLRAAVGNAIGKCGKLTLHEANEMLFQGLLAEDENLVTNVVIPLTQPRGDEVAMLAEAIPWLTLLGREKGAKVFKANRYLNFLLRILQFRVLMVQSPDEMDSLCDIVDEEFAELSDEMRSGSRFMWLMFALIYFQARIAPKRLFAYWIEAQELAEQDPELQALARTNEARGSPMPDMPDTDFAGQSLFMIVAREMTSSGLLDFADAINELPAPFKNSALAYLKRMPFPGRLAVERAWFREADKPKPNWSLIVANLAAFRAQIVGWNFPELAAFAARGAAAVEDEYRDDSVTAFAILDEALKTPTSHNYLLLDQKALILFRQKRFAEALAIWQSILPGWPVAGNTSDHTGLYASQRAAHAAGALGNWPEVLSILRRGKEFAQTANDALSVITFRADEGHALWHTGDRADALTLVAESLTELETLKPLDHQVLQIHRVRKCVEQVIKRFRFEAGATDAGDEWDPPAGFCSGLELVEKLKEFEASPYDFQWYFLADTEFRLGLGGSLLHRARTRVASSEISAFRGLVSALELRRAFHRLDFSNLIENLAGIYHSMREASAQTAAGKRVVDRDAFGNRSQDDPAALVGDGVLAALLVLAQAGESLDAFLENWQASAKKLPRHETSEHLLLAVERVLAAPTNDLAKIFNSDQEHIACSVAALRFATDPNQSLEAVFAGHASLTSWLQKCEFCSEVEPIWAELVQAEWQRRSAFPAQFSTPRLTVPPILEACSDPAFGLKKVAKILLAARGAVLIPVPDSVVTEWKRLAEKAGDRAH